MPSLNKVMLIGNVGKEPELRFTPTGKPTASFSIACNYKYGEKETTEWFSIVAWNKLAETCNQYLQKGQQVFVEGRLQTQSWETDGVTHYKTEVVASIVLFLGQRKNQEAEDLEPEDLLFD